MNTPRLRRTFAAMLLALPLTAAAQQRELPGASAPSATALFGSVQPAWIAPVTAALKSPWMSGIGGPLAALKGADLASPEARQALAPLAAVLAQAAAPKAFARLAQAEQVRRLQTAASQARRTLNARFDALMQEAYAPEAARDPRALPAIIAQLDMMGSSLSLYFPADRLAAIEKARSALRARLDEAQRAQLASALERHRAALERDGRAPTPFEAAAVQGLEAAVFDGSLRRSLPARRLKLPAFPLETTPALAGRGGDVEAAASALAARLQGTPDAPWVSKREYARRLLTGLSEHKALLLADRAAPSADFVPLIDALRRIVRAHMAERRDKASVVFDVEQWTRRLHDIRYYWESGDPSKTRQERTRDALLRWSDTLAAESARVESPAGPASRTRKAKEARGRLAFSAGMSGLGALVLMAHASLWLALPLAGFGLLFLASSVLDELGYQSWLIWR